MIKVFCSYAREDEAYLKILLDVFMKPLTRDGLVTSWHDREIAAGSDWNDEIGSHLESSDIVVLLVSNAFIASDYIAGVELKKARERRSAGESWIIPVLLEPLSRQGQVKLSGFQMVPEKPISQWARINEAFVVVIDEIYRVIKTMIGLDDYPDEVAQAMQDCYLRLDPRQSSVFLRRRYVTPEEKQRLVSKRETVGYRWPFERGEIYWSEKGGAHPTWGMIGYVFHKREGVFGDLGFPLSDEVHHARSPLGSTGAYQRFQGLEETCIDPFLEIEYGASIYWRSGSDNVTHITSGAIGRLFEDLGGTKSVLGFPMGEVTSIASDSETVGSYQEFEGGAIYHCPRRGAQYVEGELCGLYRDLGGPTGRLGFPMGPATIINKGKDFTQDFEGGTVALRIDRRPWPEDVSRLAGDSLTVGQLLMPGESLHSPSRSCRLIYQTDGNLVLYAQDGACLWASNTDNSAAGFCVLQGDGNLVIYDQTHAPLWASGALGRKGVRLEVDDVGLVRIVQQDGQVGWCRPEIEELIQN